VQLVPQILVKLAWDHAITAMEITRVTREHSAAERNAWLRWRSRWHELECQDPGQRTLVVCATCGCYRDGRGHWVTMPSGLSEVLASARSLCVSHGLCPACTTRALHAIKVLPPPTTTAAGATRD